MGSGCVLGGPGLRSRAERDVQHAARRMNFRGVPDAARNDDGGWFPQGEGADALGLASQVDHLTGPVDRQEEVGGCTASASVSTNELAIPRPPA